MKNKSRSKLCALAYDEIRSKAQSIVGSQALYRQLSADSKRDLREAGKKLLLLSDLDNALKQYNDSRNKYSTGYVYLVINAAWPDWVKVGRAVNTRNRLAAYQTSSPFRDYEIFIKAACNNTQKLESLLLAGIKEHAEEAKGEWLKIEHSFAKRLFNSIVGKHSG